MLQREKWSELTRKLDWNFTYVSESQVFPENLSGSPWLPHEQWRDWEEAFRITYADYVRTQSKKDVSLLAIRDAIGGSDEYRKLDKGWINGLKLHAATLPLAEFAAVVGNLRAARFGRDSAWRTMATYGALDELRHTQIPLLLMHELVKWDKQFDWTHKFFHSNNWMAIAARHMIDEMLLMSNPIEFAVATNFVFETGFANLQFVGLSLLAQKAGDKTFEKMVMSIQSDEARRAQIGPPVLEKLCAHDLGYAQALVDKWFWRSWHLFSILTGFSMDYFTPLNARGPSFKEFMEEWVLDQYVESLEQYGLKKPWYWDIFLRSLDNYHHMVYASAYTYRSTLWFDFVVPGPEERRWLRQKYPSSFAQYEPIWENITQRWEVTDVKNEFGVHGTSIVTFCDLCQLVLCEGTPNHNSARTRLHSGRKYIFCSEPCEQIFLNEPRRYENHKDVVKRALAGEAPSNIIALIQKYFGLDCSTWGKDAYGGDYPWMNRQMPEGPT